MLAAITGTLALLLPHVPPTIIDRGDGWLVACKPAGIAVHDGDDSLLAQLRPLAGEKKLLPVHRLDRETSGVILLATTSEAAALLQESMQAKGECVKRYKGILKGCLEPSVGRWEKPLTGKAEGRRNPQGKSAERVPASTGFRVVGGNLFLSVADFELRSGRTHQIRKHAALAGHNVLGDTRYGTAGHARKIQERYGFDGMALHAAELVVRVDGEMRTFAADPPASWASMLAPLGMAVDDHEAPSRGADAQGEGQEQEQEDGALAMTRDFDVEKAMAGFAARKAAVLEQTEQTGGLP